MFLFRLVYDVIIHVFVAGIRIAALFNPKAGKWIKGRKNWFKILEPAIPENGVDIWIHCASLGEFEQGRPVLEALRDKYPHYYILLTFFSPSGYEVRKNYAGADHICYLPLDTPGNAKKFIKLIQPRLTLFVKYEFWYHYLTELHERQLPVVLISAIFRKDQFFFRWYGKPFRKLLFFFQQIFVQDKPSALRLEEAGISGVQIIGDTRFDRVVQIAAVAKALPAIETFLKGLPCWVAGSTWPEDDQLLQLCHSKIPKWIIAPHEVNEKHLLQIEKLFGQKVIRYSSLIQAPEKYSDKSVLIIDNMGLLSSLYRYGKVAYIGGGFGHGIHNILEAAVYGLPVIFGPRYQKFKEAKDLVDLNAAFSIRDENGLTSLIEKMENETYRKDAGRRAREYVKDQTSATQKIVRYIQEKRLLTKE